MKTFKQMIQGAQRTQRAQRTHTIPIQESENRYVVTVELYMYAKDDKDVKKQANKLVKDLQKKDDNQASIVSIFEQKFGTLGNREVK